MANENKRWVVLIQKKPRGPLTELEVLTLMSKGHLRPNDLAFEISPETRKAVSDWKLLWQFPEFDRRAKADAERAAKGLPPDPKAAERRAPPAESILKEKVRSALPETLADINPEDLIPRAKAQGGRSELEVIEQSIQSESNGGGFALKWVYAGVALLIAGLIGVQQWKAPRATEERSPADASNTESAPETPSAQQTGPRVEKSLPGGIRSRSAPMRAPRARDNNENGSRDGGSISYGEFKEKELERLEREELEEEEENVTEEAAFESKPPKKGARSFKSKRIIREVTEEEPEENNTEETFPETDERDREVSDEETDQE